MIQQYNSAGALLHDLFQGTKLYLVPVPVGICSVPLEEEGL